MYEMLIRDTAHFGFRKVHLLPLVDKLRLNQSTNNPWDSNREKYQKSLQLKLKCLILGSPHYDLPIIMCQDLRNKVTANETHRADGREL